MAGSRLSFRSPGALAWAALLGVVACLLGLAPASAQSAAPATGRPKIALVLSGGGAMGIAHVGAIQELERLGIRPDLVVGTSMGSIVGGLYASGLNGAQLQQAVETMNWDAIFDASPSRDGLSYRQKQQQADFPVKASVGVAEGRLLMPEAFVSDANLLLQLRRLLGTRAAVPNFDALPIPFRAVATDIETGHKVVLDHGELAAAMRASMSVPGVFAPYQIDGQLLVDGGMADNIPIDVARDLGADIIIVATTQSPLAKAEDVRSIGQILGQTVGMLILANERAQLATLKPTDVLIPIDTKGLTTADFKRGREMIAAGRDSALTKEAELRRVAALYGPAAATVATSTAAPSKVIDYVRVENDSKLSDEILERHVEQFVGKPMDPDAIVVALQAIYAVGVFTRVDYSIEEKDGRTGLVVHGEQKPGDANRLRPGVTIAATGQGRSQIDFSFDYRMMQLDGYGSEARFVGVLGARKRFSAEYFKVLDSRQRWFVVPAVDLQKRPVPVYDSSGFRLGEYDVGYAQAAIAAGRQFGSFGEFRVGLQGGTGEAKRQEGFVTPEKVDLDLGQVFARAGYDSLDNAYFPTRGFKAQLEWTLGDTGLNDVADYQKVGGAAFYAFGSRRDTVILNVEGGDTYDGVTPLHSLFSLGGPFSFPGFNVDELTGQTYAAARVMYRHRLTDNATSLFHLALYIGAELVTGNTWANDRDVTFDTLRVGGSVFVAADTFIGPVFLSVGHADSGRAAFYLFVGRPF